MLRTFANSLASIISRALTTFSTGNCKGPPPILLRADTLADEADKFMMGWDFKFPHLHIV